MIWGYGRASGRHILRWDPASVYLSSGMIASLHMMYSHLLGILDIAKIPLLLKNEDLSLQK